MFDPQIEIGVLWVKESKRGEMYFSGKLHLAEGERKIVALPIRNPTNDKRMPQFKIVEARYEAQIDSNTQESDSQRTTTTAS